MSPIQDFHYIYKLLKFEAYFGWIFCIVNGTVSLSKELFNHMCFMCVLHHNVSLAFGDKLCRVLKVSQHFSKHCSFYVRGECMCESKGALLKMGQSEVSAVIVQVEE